MAKVPLCHQRVEDIARLGKGRRRKREGEEKGKGGRRRLQVGRLGASVTELVGGRGHAQLSPQPSVADRGPMEVSEGAGSVVEGKWPQPGRQRVQSCSNCLDDLWGILIRNRTGLALWFQRMLPAGTVLEL